MSTVSTTELLKVLDKDPAWKAATALPAQLTTLEMRVAALEAKREDRPSAPCPLCHAPMRMIAAVPYPLFGDQGLQMHSFACIRCSNTELRRIDLNTR